MRFISKNGRTFADESCKITQKQNVNNKGKKV